MPNFLNDIPGGLYATVPDSGFCDGGGIVKAIPFERHM